MWNPFKIYKLSKSVFKTDVDELRELSADQNGDQRLNEVQALYREMMFPSNLRIWRRMTSSHEGRQIIWGMGFNDRKYVEDEVIPKLANKEWLQSLPSNTLGGHLGNLFKTWNIQELYAGRFLEEEKREGVGQYTDSSDQMRANMSRHAFLTHDIIHTLFRYDTSPFGEACVQGVTYNQIPHIGTWYVGFVVALRFCYRYKSLQPLKVYREAVKLGQRAFKKGLIYYSPIEFLEMDIGEIRKKFDIGIPVEYIKWQKEHPEGFRNDVLHPEYRDVEWEKVSEISI